MFDIVHETRYSYSAPVRESVMELWLQPAELPKQRLVNFQIATLPRARMFRYRDWLGNLVYHFDVPQPHTELVIKSLATVSLDEDWAHPPSVNMVEWDRLSRAEIREPWWDFLQPSTFAQPTALLQEFLKAHGLTRGPDPLTGLRYLNTVIADAFDYVPGYTAVDSPIDVALAARKGVCQDFAHIMIAAARLWGIPARYVSGYLVRHMDDSHERSLPDASHAWVECFVPSLGWIGFDPTNHMLAAERHIVVAYGRDYADVPPTRGVLQGDATADLSVSVQVSRGRLDWTPSDFLREVRPPRLRPSEKAAGTLMAAQQQQQQQQ
jgi:transglutaminase-like putative cysteine protease